jgi:hypothetical protein
MDVNIDNQSIFSNAKNNILENIEMLPNEIIDIIYTYLPNIVTLFIKKENYLKNHSIIYNYIKPKNSENYIRTMIRQDNDFIFDILLKENYTRWLEIKDYYYKKAIYLNYLHFLNFYCIEHESIKCRNLIINLFNELGFNKNKYKKNIIRYIKWKN